MRKTKGKKTCELLRSVRQYIAEINEIDYSPEVCNHIGYCTGTCPICDAEVEFLLQALKNKEANGESINLMGVFDDIDSVHLSETEFQSISDSFEDDPEEDPNSYVTMGLIADNARIIEKPNKMYSDDQKTLLSVPNYYQGDFIVKEGVTTIGEAAFMNCSGLKKVVLPNSVEVIEMCAFESSSLEEIIIPESVRSIGGSAFSYCKNLKKVVLPNSIKEISPQLFHYCENLKEIQLPYSLKSIGRGAFCDCGNLGDLVIPEGVKVLESETIFNNNKMKYLYLPSTLEKIERLSIITTGLKGIKVHPDNPVFCDEDGILMSKDKSKIIYFPQSSGINNYVVPNYVTQIEGFAFQGCKKLVSVKLHENIEYIGEDAFEYCEKLVSINVPAKCILGRGCLSHTGLTEYSLPNGIEDLPENLFSSCKRLLSVTLPSSVKKFNSIFDWCNHLKEIHIRKKNPSRMSYYDGEFKVKQSEYKNEDSFFSSDYFQYCKSNLITLYVPIGSKEKYQNHFVFKYFNNIIEE